ncbi:amidohydrolase family protein, partial [Sandarakinorhabdus rubra]|uniref:amidohydrolase family protein n=1 Tax=Sandarakinorhabdus rubra TaxID=2672568 RepID=UPI0013DCF39C
MAGRRNGGGHHDGGGRQGGLARRDLFRLGALGGAGLAAAGGPLAASSAQPGKVGASRRALVTVEDVTNVALALSPDGRTLAFDLLGLLWTLPVGGGQPRRLSGEFDDLAQPDWMAGGQRLVFQSYRSGHFHIWSCAADGSDWRQHTDGLHDNREVRASPDGRWLAFSSDRADGRYAIHLLDLANGSVRMLSRGSSQDSEPCWSPDSRRVAYVADGNRLLVTDLEGTTTEAAAVPRSADRTRPSEIRAPGFAPDGSLAWSVVSAGAVTMMWRGKPVIEGEDLYPFRPAFAADGSLIHAATGKIRRRAPDGSSRVIPFRTQVPVVTPSYARHRQLADPAAPPAGPQPVMGIHAPQLSADGRRVLLRALNDIWLLDVGGGARRLVADAAFKCDPAWSPDGRSIVYASDRGGTLDLWVRDIASGQDRQLTDLKGQAAVSPSWSLDGSQVAFLDQSGALHTVDVASGRVQRRYDALWEPGRPTWSPDGRHVAMAAFRPTTPRYREGYSEILVIDLVTGRGRYHAVGPGKSIATRGDDGPVWSPDGCHLAYVMGSTLWVLPVDASGTPTGAPKQITREVTDAPTWRGDSGALLYLNNGRLRLVGLDGGAPATIPCPISWAAPRLPARTIVRAGRWWDGSSDAYRGAADVVIEGSRIAAIQPASGPLPSADVVIDGRDLTLIPGLIDMHTHRQMQGYGYGDRMDRLFLAMGITTTRSPGCPAYQMVEAREALASGARLGPRHFACGEAVDGSRIFYNFMRPVTEPGQMALEMERARALGYDMIKTYVRMTHKVQAEVTAMAHAMGLHVASHYHYPALNSGVDCTEHLGATSRYGYSRTITALGAGYGDVNGLFAAAKAARTPTLFGAGVLMGEDDSLPSDRRVRSLMPAWDLAKLDARVAAIRSGDPAPQLAVLRRNVEQIKATLALGHHLIAGTDAPIDFVAISLHLNLRAMTRFGVRPVDALRTATGHAGAFLAEPVGEVARGKLADLLLVGGDPLADVAAAADVRHLVLN